MIIWSIVVIADALYNFP